MFFYVSLLCFSMLVFSLFVGQNEGENLTQALKFCVPLEQKREEVSVNRFILKNRNQLQQAAF